MNIFKEIKTINNPDPNAINADSNETNNDSNQIADNKPPNRKKKRVNVNWHDMLSAAIQIDLRDYSDFLDYYEEEYILNNHLRIDLIIIKKHGEIDKANPLASLFTKTNIFENKGVGSTLKYQDFYKGLVYAFGYGSENCDHENLVYENISLFFMVRHYPRKLISSLKKSKYSIEKISKGIYHLERNEIPIYFIVTKMLPEEHFLYLNCATNEMDDSDIDKLKKLINDYKSHKKIDLEPQSELYRRYVCQLQHAYLKKKGTSKMEWNQFFEETRDLDSYDFYLMEKALLAKVDKMEAEMEAKVEAKVEAKMEAKMKAKMETARKAESAKMQAKMEAERDKLISDHKKATQKAVQEAVQQTTSENEKLSSELSDALNQINILQEQLRKYQENEQKLKL